MNLYRIYVSGPANVTHMESAQRWAGSMVEARAKREELMDEAGASKKSVTIEPYEVPTRKEDLLAWLNDNCNKQPTEDEESEE